MTIDTPAASRLSTPAPNNEAQYRRRALVGDALVVTLWVTSALAVGLFLVSGGGRPASEPSPMR